MSYKKSKSTKRFNFTINRDTKSHKAGSNTVTITGREYATVDRGYSTNTGTFGPSHELTMTVKEAQALQKFLNETLSKGSSKITS